MNIYPNEIIPKGKSIYYWDGHSAPEMKGEAGKTSKPFSYKGDSWQLACAFQAMLNKGAFEFTTPKDTEQDIADLIKFMKVNSPTDRPNMA